MKERIIAKKIKVKFNGRVVTLSDETDRQKTKDGVEIWIQRKPGNGIRPMADIPDGTLDIYKHCRPEILSLEWIHED